MALFKCKMCGGDLEIAEGVTIAECEYCGTKQTVPKAMDENLQSLFNRANTLRIKSEFDKAEKIYEKIIQADSTQSEAYWGLILCKYGIEYVDDPVTFKKIPTCHRASYDSIIADDDYKVAIENADFAQRAIYEEQAKEIDRIQKEILSLAQKEETYDVFICYKETDVDGRRTQDSVIANDIYYQLTQEGFKVFYAAITLEGKLGSAYEPIIFAALNSAKVMLSIGTKPEYFNAVWVKNEWSRYLKIIKKDRSKLLIPCYRDMDAYELPEEFAHLQAQDMAKIGFINDIVRGIKKVIRKEEIGASATKENGSANSAFNTTPLLKRIFIFLEDGDWDKANEYCEKVLDIDPENSQAYLGKLMVDLRLRTREQLKDQDVSFQEHRNFKKAFRFADQSLKKELMSYVEYCNERLAEEKKKAEERLAEEKKKAEERLAEEKKKKEEQQRIEEEARKEAEEKEKCVALFAEMRENYRNQSEYIERKGEVEYQLSLLTTHLEDLLSLKNGWENIEQEERLISGMIESVHVQIINLEDQKNSLTFFSSKKRNEITRRIDDLERELLSMRQNKEETLNKRHGFASFVQVCEAIEYVEEKIGVQKTILEELSHMPTENQYRAELSQYQYGEELLKKYDELSNAKVGCNVEFGAYVQNNWECNVREPIGWKILAREGSKLLLISNYALDCQQYNTKDRDVTWERCSLRRWLNNVFYDEAFSAAEKAVISRMVSPSNKSAAFRTSHGNHSDDRVFILNLIELNKYLNNNIERECKPTAYAISRGALVNSGSGNVCWWLSSQGDQPYKAACVYHDGSVGEYGLAVSNCDYAVRPAIWIDLNS